MFTTNDSAYPAAFDLHDAGVTITAVVDARARVGAGSARRVHRARHRRPYRGSVVSGTAATHVSPDAIVDRPGDDAARAVIRMRRAARQRRLESGGAPVQPGPRKAALRRRHRRIRARRTTRRRSASPARPTACSTYRDACEAARQAAASAITALGFSGRIGTRLRARLIRLPAQARRRRAVVRARPRMPRPASSSTCSATRPSADLRPRACGAACASMEHIKRYTTIGTAHDQGKTSGVIASGIIAEPSARRSRTSAPPPSGRRTRRCRSPRWPGGTAAHLFDPSGSPPCTTGTSSTARCSRTSAVETSVVLPAAPGEDMDDRGAARMRRRPRRSRHPRRLHPRQDRRPGAGRGRVPRPALHQPDEHPEGRDGPLRRDVRRRRHGHRRRHRHAVRRRPVPWCSPPPAAPRKSSTGWRNGCRPSGRTFGSG